VINPRLITFVLNRRLKKNLPDVIELPVMEILKINTEICIVGAGPAGVTTSITLSNMGIAHTIVDAAEFPRDKICGDAIDLNVVRVLNTILPGFTEKEMCDRSLFSPAAGLRFILPNGKHFDMVQKDGTDSIKIKSLFQIAKRVDFDRLMVAQLNPDLADIHLGTRIEKIEKINTNWKIYGTGKSGKIEIEAKMLVGADGAHSVVLKHIGDVKIDRENYAGAVRQYWKGIEGISKDKLIEFYFPKSLPLSYFWIFPLPNNEANVGYGMSSSYIAKKNINVRKAFEELIKTDPFLAGRFKNATPQETVKGYGLPLSGSNRKAFGDGWILVGDAASIICPTTGEGIGSGMISGYIAAAFLQRAHKHGCYQQKMFTNYNREIHKRLRMDERVFKLVNTIPAWAFFAFLKGVLLNRFLQKWIVKKEIRRWINTAYTKPIKVNLN
jgi:geranylgeranyl reductase family protein